MFTGIEGVVVIPRRRWTTAASFSLQAAVVAVALVLPLLHPTNLPEAFTPHRIFVPIFEREIPATPQDPSHGGAGNVGFSAPPIVVPRDIGVHFGPARPVASPNEAPPWPFDPSGPGPGGPNLGQIPITTIPPVLAKPPVISVMMQGNLIHRVEPVYPPIAKLAGVQGAVLIQAVIGANGRIEQAQVVSGSPLLSVAALDAIRQWKYKPYFLNGSPIEVETEITVNFVLQR